MSHHIQSQLFPENFLYVIAPEQTNILKKELEVYHQPTRGFRIFSEVGFWDPKIEKKKFLSQNDRKWSETETLMFLSQFRLFLWFFWHEKALGVISFRRFYRLRNLKGQTFFLKMTGNIHFK